MIDTVEIVLVGKYTSLQDSYMSVVKSLEHSAMRCHRKLKLKWVEASDLEPQTASDNPVRYHEAWHSLCSAKGILVPGGFGVRGTEGMISAAKWAREKRVPYLGICLGFQIAVIEFARNVCGLTGESFRTQRFSFQNPIAPSPPHHRIALSHKWHMISIMTVSLSESARKILYSQSQRRDWDPLQYNSHTSP
jgi:CTP synthase (UTP-ammonia lyase)